jgi:hypothetical protein
MWQVLRVFFIRQYVKRTYYMPEVSGADVRVAFGGFDIFMA